MPDRDGYYANELPITPPPIPGEDFMLSAARLKAKYARQGEHPLFPNLAWRDEVADGFTEEGYWEWVADSVAAWEYTP